MTPEQKIILRKLRSNPKTRHRPTMTDWEPRVIRHGLTLYVRRIGKYYYADVRTEKNASIFLTLTSNHPVKNLGKLYKAFMALVTEKVGQAFRADSVELALPYVFAIEELIRRFSR